MNDMTDLEAVMRLGRPESAPGDTRDAEAQTRVSGNPRPSEGPSRPAEWRRRVTKEAGR